MRREMEREIELGVSHRLPNEPTVPHGTLAGLHHIRSEFRTPYHHRPQCDHTLILWVGMELPEALEVSNANGKGYAVRYFVHRPSLIHSPPVRRPSATRTRMCLTGGGRPLTTSILLILYRIGDHHGGDRMEAEKGCLRNGFSGSGIAKEPPDKTRALRHQSQRLPQE